MRTFALFLRLAPVAAAFVFPACQRPAPTDEALPQRGYLWQRDWTPAVTAGLAEVRGHVNGVIVLGAEIHWNGAAPRVVRTNIAWPAVRTAGLPCAVAIRVEPFAGPFAPDDAGARTITETFRSLLAEAKAAGVAPVELQLDFDCAQKKLAGYRRWVEAVRPAVSPVPLVLTTLPAWLDEPEFLPLVRAADGYVLQVHSVPTTANGGRAVLCDPALARCWVEKAARLGRPFSVALPTYRCLAGYGPDGKLRGVVMDSVRPAWPPDTRVREFGTEADEVAELVHAWQAARPAGLRELIWYRLPVASDQYNWRWPTLAAVMAGRKPVRQLEAVSTGGNPADLAVVNAGEADESLDRAVVVEWDGGPATAADSLAGWTLRLEPRRAIFTPDPGGRLPPGARRSIGWLRHDTATPLRLRLEARPD